MFKGSGVQKLRFFVGIFIGRHLAKLKIKLEISFNEFYQLRLQVSSAWLNYTLALHSFETNLFQMTVKSDLIESNACNFDSKTRILLSSIISKLNFPNDRPAHRKASHIMQLI